MLAKKDKPFYRHEIGVVSNSSKLLGTSVRTQNKSHRAVEGSRVGAADVVHLCGNRTLGRGGWVKVGHSKSLRPPLALLK